MEAKSFSSQIPNFVLNIGNVDKINQILNGYQENLIVIMFTSPQCGACKGFLPVFEKAQQEFYSQKVIFIKINVQDLPEVAKQFNIMGTPTTIFIRNKKGKKRQVGMVTLAKFRMMISENVYSKK